MPLKDLIDSTCQFFKSEFPKYKNPVLAWSGGKDSTVLLHLLRRCNIHLPILLYTDPWFRRKFDFANKVASMWNLEVHDYPPAKTSLLYGKEIVALVSEYQTSAYSVLSVLKNALEFRDGDDSNKFLCGVRFLTRPCAIYIFPWDMVLVGHRDADTDQIYGPVPLHAKIVFRDEGPDYCFPLKEWSDNAIWDYIEAFNVPIQTDRYDVANRCELPDKTLNSDWYEVCIRCVDKRRHGEKVFCPKFGAEILNVSGAAPEYGTKPDYFGVKG